MLAHIIVQNELFSMVYVTLCMRNMSDFWENYGLRNFTNQPTLRTELPLRAASCSSYQPDLLLMKDQTADKVAVIFKLK